MPWKVTDPDGTVHTYERRPENSNAVFVPDPRSLVPDAVLRILAAEGAPAPSGWTERLGDLASEVLALRDAARAVLQSSPDPGMHSDRDAGAPFCRQCSAEDALRALLPEHGGGEGDPHA